jgi:O-antigen ligase
MSHAHNGLLGTALYFGLVGLAAFGVMIAVYAKNLIRQPDGALRFFGLASLIFSFGYMGADLSNPFAFFNTHYLFMWFPIFLVSVRREQAPAASSPDSLQRM